MSTPRWRKSIRSDGSGNDHIEAARLPSGVGLRDSKDPDAGRLAITPTTFAGLLNRIRTGELDL